jgi:PPIC-type PPIASE domain
VKRFLSLSITLLVAGGLASSCGLSAPAARVNGTDIAVSAFDHQLSTYESTGSGACLLEAETGQTGTTQGTGGQGTFDMAFADQILQNLVGDVLAAQLAASKGLTVTSANLSTAKQHFAATLDGEISAAIQTDSQNGVQSNCLSANGQPVTGALVLSGLPGNIQTGLVHNDAVDEKLLADGADLSDAAVLAYYQANQAPFTDDCVSAIATDTQAHATQYVAQINGGASFAAVAKANSLDSQSAAKGGALGCTASDAQLAARLQLQSVPVNTPIGPLQDSSNGAWVIFEVTSKSVVALSDASSVIKQALLQTTANGDRVAKQIVAFAKRVDVSIDPHYGTWSGHVLLAPVAPPAKFLLAAVSGQPQPPTSSLGLGRAGGGAAGGAGGGAGSPGSGTPPVPGSGSGTPPGTGTGSVGGN